MNQYTIYCTEEQTRKAMELGAPIKYVKDNSMNYPCKVLDRCGNPILSIPTAEQMIGWIEEQHSLQFLTGVDDEDKFFFNVYHTEGYIEVRDCNSRKEATLAAIDAVLEYLSNKI